MDAQKGVTKSKAWPSPVKKGTGSSESTESVL